MPFDIYPTSTRKMRCPASSNQGETIASIPLWGFTSAACVQSSRRDGSTTNLDGVCSWTDTLIDHIFNGRMITNERHDKRRHLKGWFLRFLPLQRRRWGGVSGLGSGSFNSDSAAAAEPRQNHHRLHGVVKWAGAGQWDLLLWHQSRDHVRTHVRPELFGLKGRIAQPLARSKTF